ncbi:MAG: tyrosine-type recombinase/integrase [Actinomycetota bacterium]|nr:site-specific tyrosine recombinase XerD [Acidimicrobiaceae bacterium]MEC7915054.1 tyrosine-type recombinase/integrase [Actinomycetota bacterium]MEC9058661.1 tyrosine-type recombinase/integrase [Actinomycetota bacterium]
MTTREETLWLGQFLDWKVLNKGRTLTTKEAYQRDLNAFLVWLDSTGQQLKTVDEDHIASYVEHLHDSNYQISTVARAVVAIKELFSFLSVEEEILAANPSENIGVPTVREGPPKALTYEQIESLLGSPVGDDPATYRDRAVLEVLYGCGLRVGELIGLDTDDVYFDKQQLRVFGKGRRERIVPLGAEAHHALSQWMSGAGRQAALTLRRGSERRKVERAVFLSLAGPTLGTRLSRMGAWGIVRRHGDKVGLDRKLLTPHVLRHSCATHMMVNGADIRFVQKFLGHVSIRSTQRYTSLRFEELRARHAQAHPRSEVESGEYLVAEGDTLIAIANRFGIDLSDLLRENNISDPTEIYVDQTLRIPSPPDEAVRR